MKPIACYYLKILSVSNFFRTKQLINKKEERQADIHKFQAFQIIKTSSSLMQVFRNVFKVISTTLESPEWVNILQTVWSLSKISG